MAQGKDEAQEKRDKDVGQANTDSVEAMEKVRQDMYDREKQAYLNEKIFEYQRNYAKVMDELRRQHIKGKSQDGKDITESDELLKMCKDVLDADVQAYTDFRSNLNSMWKICTKVNEVNSTRIEQIAGELWDKTGHKLEEKLNIHAMSRLKTFLLHSVLKPHSDIDISTLQQKVGFKDGKVDIQQLTRSDGTPLPFEMSPDGTKVPTKETVKLNNAFKIYVEAWLLENNYASAGPEGKYEHKTTKTPLDEAAFKKLNEKPETSFSSFLKQTAALEYEERQEDAPRPPI